MTVIFKTDSPCTLMTEHNFISSTKAANILNVSLRTIHLWVEKGTLQAWKTPGGHRKITLASVEKIQHQQSEVAERNTSLPGIVIIENNPSQRMRYQDFFNKQDFPVELTFADNGYAGLIAIGQHKPDLVITDLEIPNMDGVQLIQEIRKQPELTNLNIIIISSMDKADIEQQADCRDCAIFSRPIDFELLSSYISKHLAELKE